MVQFLEKYVNEKMLTGKKDSKAKKCWLSHRARKYKTPIFCATWRRLTSFVSIHS